MATKKKKKKAGEVLTSSALAKKYVGSGIASQIVISPEDRIWLPSSNLTLNFSLGGGVPYGKILELYGTESGGKTLMAQDFGVSAQELGGIVLWGDAERAFDPHWFELTGLDLDRIELYPENSVEWMSDWSADMAVTWRNKLTANEPIIFILDSTAALDCEENINSAQIGAKAEMGNRAKAIYKMLRIRNKLWSELGVISIFINQLRDKVGAGKYEDPETTPGGNALKFFAALRVGVYAGAQIKGMINGFEDRVGGNVSIRIRKNKVAPPRKTFKSEVYFNEEFGKIGFERYLGLPEVLIRLGVLEKKKGGTSYKFNGKTIAIGEKNMNEVIAEDDRLRKKLIRRSGINTISHTQRKIDNQTENLYPVSNVKVERHNEADEENYE